MVNYWVTTWTLEMLAHLKFSYEKKENGMSCKKYSKVKRARHLCWNVVTNVVSLFTHGSGWITNGLLLLSAIHSSCLEYQNHFPHLWNAKKVLIWCVFAIIFILVFVFFSPSLGICLRKGRMPLVAFTHLWSNSFFSPAYNLLCKKCQKSLGIFLQTERVAFAHLWSRTNSFFSPADGCRQNVTDRHQLQTWAVGEAK